VSWFFSRATPQRGGSRKSQARARRHSPALVEDLESRVLLSGLPLGGIGIPGLPSLPSLNNLPINNLPLGLGNLTGYLNPNPSDFWWLKNTGQTLSNPTEGPATGTPGADIDATDAWNITQGSSNVVIAVLDTGIDLSNPDLNSVLWTNPGNLPGDTFTNDIHGWNFLNNSSDVSDNFVHGTAVAATIHSVAPGVTILPVEIGTASGVNAQDVIDGINYVIMLKKAGVNIVAINASYIDYNAPSTGEINAIKSAGSSGMLYIAAAGNAGMNFDSLVPQVPSFLQGYVNNYISNFLPSNMMFVAATDNQDHLASFSDYGKDFVAVGAPGVDITLPIPGGLYAPLSGTSFAAPMVSAIAALLKSRLPTATMGQIQNAILKSGDPDPALAGKTITGRRVNAFNALQYLLGNQPGSGAIQSISSSSISGWAYDPTLGSGGAAVQVSIDGVTYPTVVANNPDDNTPATAGSGDHGFSFDVPDLPYGKHAVKVYVLNDVTGTPTLIGQGSVVVNQPPTGAIESSIGKTLTGWAQDPDTPTTPVKVKLYVDGKLLSTVTAGINRPDLADTLGSANHGYSFKLNTLKPGIHRMDVYAVDSLTGAAILIGTSQINTNQPATGNLETITSSQITGWAYDPDAGNAAVQVRYQIDDFAPVFVTANVSRPDLQATLGSRNHGFTINLPQLIAGDHTITVDVVDPNSRQLIELGSQDVTVASPDGNDLPTGTLDTLTTTQAAGTVTDSDSAGPIQVRIDIDGKPGKPFTSTTGDGDPTTYNYSYTLPRLSAGPHRVDVYAIDALSGTPVLIASSLVNDTPATGSVETLNATAASGWAYTPSGKALVRLDVDDLIGAPITASLPRPDLAGTLNATNVGFNIPMPQLAPGDHTVTLTLIDPVTLEATTLGTQAFTTT